MIMDTEMTLEGVLSDPLIQMLMRADRVDPEEMRSVWTEIGAALRGNAEAGRRAPERIQPDLATAVATPRDLRGLITDCICAEAARMPASSRQTKTGSM